MIEQAIQMALLPNSVYEKLTEVFDMYEKGMLKDQSPVQFSGQNLRMALERRFAAKLQHFKIFQGMKVR